MTRRIVIEEPDRICLHGNTFGKCVGFIDYDAGIRCPGGLRTVIEPDAAGNWPDIQFAPGGFWTYSMAEYFDELIDALAEHRSEP